MQEASLKAIDSWVGTGCMEVKVDPMTRQSAARLIAFPGHPLSLGRLWMKLHNMIEKQVWLPVRI